MSIFAVKNDKGLLMDDLGQFKRDRAVCAFHSKSDAKDWADNKHAHVVELVEAPAKVVVSEKEAKMLESAKADKRPITHINNFSEWYGSDDQDRLMNAYVIGWTVEKPKRYGVWVPHVKGKMYFKDGRGGDGLDIASADCLNEANQQFTAAEIEHYGLHDFDKLEVTDDAD